MRMRLVTATAVVALLAGTSMAMAQGGEGGRDSGAAGAAREHGAAGGAMSHEGGARETGGKTGGEKMGQGGGEKAGSGEKTGAGEKAKMGAGETGREDRKADRADKGDKADRADRGDKADKADKGQSADRGEHGDREHADRDHDRGGRDRADRGDRDNAHVNIRVGGGVPEGRRLAPLKTTLVERYPQYRGFQSFVENDEIIIVDPGTHKIVRTVSEGEAGMNHAASTNCR